MSNSMQRLGATLSNRMKKTANSAVPTTLELGIVNANLSITTDSLQAEIPKGDYMVNLMLTGSRSTSSAAYPFIDGDHSHELPAGFRGLKAGDRILVSWCGNEPVVIAIVNSSAVLTFAEGGSAPGGDSSGSGGSGTPDQDGKDGFSPTVTVTPITGGNRVTITDVNGPKTFDIMDGKTPKKGVDYFTAEEVEGIVAQAVAKVLQELEGKFYTKNQIDSMFATDEEVIDMLDEFYGEGE